MSKVIILSNLIFLIKGVVNIRQVSYRNFMLTKNCNNFRRLSNDKQINYKWTDIMKNLNIQLNNFISKLYNQSFKAGSMILKKFQSKTIKENIYWRKKGNTEMPWLGMDIGGTLSKLVYFEPTDTKKSNEILLLSNAIKYLLKKSLHGKSGHRDVHLQMNNTRICDRIGTLHFIRFSTIEINNFLEIVKGMTNIESSICVTGGGAFKFEDNFKNILNVKLCKCDELDSLIRGLLFITASNNHECYFWSQNSQVDVCSTQYHPIQYNKYPFIIVNIGSGVSVLAVYGPNDYKRIYGTSIGGGTFLGLCSLLTGCNTFDEAIKMASKGDNTKVDKLVRDIYGDSYRRFNLSGEIVASSFGHMNCEKKRRMVSKEDLARATLVTVTNNIASIAIMCALNENIYRVYFVGNFLRENSISMKLLSHAMNYWSNDTRNALFLRHEGYFGAIGCLLSFDKKRKL